MPCVSSRALQFCLEKHQKHRKLEKIKPQQINTSKRTDCKMNLLHDKGTLREMSHRGELPYLRGNWGKQLMESILLQILEAK